MDKTFCRQVFQIPKNKQVILFVSDDLANQRKGLSILIDAIENLNKEQYVLCCIGNSKSLSVGGMEIINLGQIRDERLMSIAYNAADVFVLPSREDNLPNVVLEALCCGTPVVGFKVGGMPEMINNGVNGQLATSISPKELYNAIIAVLNNLKSYNKSEISQDAAFRYSSELQASKYLSVYKSFT